MDPVSGGLASFHISGGTANTTNATNIKAAPGCVYNVTLINTSGTLGYLRFYDTASTPTPTSATGAGPILPVPASTTGAGVTATFGPYGIAFANGISFVVTGAGTDTDNSAGPAGIYPVILYA